MSGRHLLHFPDREGSHGTVGIAVLDSRIQVDRAKSGSGSGYARRALVPTLEDTQRAADEIARLTR